MSSIAFWNNKGGVGKTLLAFIGAVEFALKNKDRKVYVIDLCPQANLTEMLLGGSENDAGAKLGQLMKSSTHGGIRKTIAGYFLSRFESPY